MIECLAIFVSPPDQKMNNKPALLQCCLIAVLTLLPVTWVLSAELNDEGKRFTTSNEEHVDESKRNFKDTLCYFFEGLL